MEQIGQYVLTRELHAAALGGVWLATTTDRPGETFVVKLFQAQSRMDRHAAAAESMQVFLERARTQRQLVVSGARHWAPVHDAAIRGDVAYYATNYYEHTLKRLMDGMVRFNIRSLHTVVFDILAGLTELRQSLALSHGNLSSGNVMLRGPRGKPWSHAVLTDPHLTDASDPALGEAADVNALGRLVFQMVNGKPPAGNAIDATVAVNENWAALGAGGERWRQLCEQMLSSTPPSVTSLEVAIAAMKPRHALSSRAAIAVGVGLLVMAACFAGAALIAPGNDCDTCESGCEHCESMTMATATPSPPPPKSLAEPCISCAEDDVRVDFGLKVSLFPNRSTLYDGDEYDLAISLTRSVHLTVLGVTIDPATDTASVYRLTPNRLRPQTQMLPGTRTLSALMGAKVEKFYIGPPYGREQIIAIATEEPIAIDPAAFAGDGERDELEVAREIVGGLKAMVRSGECEVTLGQLIDGLACGAIPGEVSDVAFLSSGRDGSE